MDIEFKSFNKIPRYSREVIVTEKIDGTNASVYIGENGEFLTGSRTRWITPDNDNFGFSKWAHEHKEEIMQLGAGHHFGEWWGSGIQRGYGLPKGEKRFSLFNVTRWCLHGNTPKQMTTADPRIVKVQDILPPCIGLVPVLWRGTFDDLNADAIIYDLKTNGSRVANFDKPEGIIIYHVAGNMMFKKTVEKDEQPKGVK